ncbi:uncharacterized protein SPPG_07278 [Spizellomyces punctatus DAOM BR117]|uniref:LysM domain-containing protein n=1 Tax=Spizellomyces punctatus (strain DAOM BR117) TaxID=645134 RepID=A0A0L0H749_SPIPD|nr:uncharacterized protein SPPG_07278 [Spizellomyces punctatus DAOM BR117]KNC97350.1 hypothetical protein SPPG_07278 [Spizellomyces punctatus DAOM BR117]|eukprot:XP_016605390.1 hypothetical protein SPPG_07278 [Spizellomyces punctatus DAOM BR117]
MYLPSILALSTLVLAQAVLGAPTLEIRQASPNYYYKGSAFTGQTVSGRATYYGQTNDPSDISPQKSTGSCLYTPGSVTKWFAALNSQQYSNGLYCGMCVQVTCTDQSKCAGGKPIVVQVVDLCPSCGFGGLDLSFGAMSVLMNGDANAELYGTTSMQWRQVDCSLLGTSGSGSTPPPTSTSVKPTSTIKPSSTSKPSSTVKPTTSPKVTTTIKATTTAKPTPSSGFTGCQKYTVKSGDSCWSIGQKFGVSVAQLDQWNNNKCSSGYIYPHEVLCVSKA